LEQTYTKSVSLRSLLKQEVLQFAFGEVGDSGNEVYADMLKKGIFSFDISESLFPDQKHVRIRGINLYVSLNAYKKKQANIELMNGSIAAEITPPVSSQYTLLGLTTDGLTYDINTFGTVRQVNYGLPFYRIPTAHVGKIGTKGFIRPPETAGSNVFYNVSPFGRWTITFPQIVHGNLNDLFYVDDVYVDLLVAVRNDP